MHFPIHLEIIHTDFGIYMKAIILTDNVHKTLELLFFMGYKSMFEKYNKQIIMMKLEEKYVVPYKKLHILF